MNQPPSGATPKNSVPKNTAPPTAYAQKAYADRRGNGRSRAPSIAGSRYTAMASTTGTAKRNIITVPCIVKTWL
jgi:hypothetical protein